MQEEVTGEIKKPVQLVELKVEQLGVVKEQWELPVVPWVSEKVETFKTKLVATPILSLQCLLMHIER